MRRHPWGSQQAQVDFTSLPVLNWILGMLYTERVIACVRACVRACVTEE